jgi:glutamyl-tRNA(Gln) amidotransferase subunit E
VKAGLEVHQQLSTGKLFCECPTELSDVPPSAVVTRRLRATGGENHHVDRAAAFQAAKELTFRYEVTPSSCLVELDEEPPRPMSEAALDVALTVAALLHARPVGEIEVMRKIVVDGSNTSGFQRTALVAVDGHLDLEGKRYSIQSICLEEDAARKVGEKRGELTFRLDRLGIPLIEIATGPEITTGTEAREVAQELGSLLRSTGRVRRGIGTIREDLNVSTEGGARIEIKGVQELRLLHRYAEREEERQRLLLDVRDKLRERAASVPREPIFDVAGAVPREGSGLLIDARRQEQPIRAVRLLGFGGLLKGSGPDSERLGRELADRARAAGLRGLVHSDELPGYGLDDAAVSAIRTQLSLAGTDAFVLVTAPDVAHADRALAQVRERAEQALEGIPEETRDPLPDGRTRYSRPLPGRDRMYPETDVPPVPVAPERLARLRASLPERPSEARARIQSKYGLNAEQVRHLSHLGRIPEFEAFVAAGHPVPRVARLLTQDLDEAVALVGEPAPELDETVLLQVLDRVARGAFAKEGVRPVLIELLRGSPNVDSAVESAGLSAGPTDDLSTVADRLVEQNAALVDARGAEAFQALMGDMMRELRGRRDGREIAEALRAAIARRSARPPGA